MAKDYKREDILYPDQKIIQSELVHEMQTSYIEYAMSVIVGRALPDVRDGLKPVHRRILYAMYEDNLTSDKPFKKSATCVGDVLGRYHPHGDASVYDAMVRLAQDFSMRYMLVDGHGNFGSVDGDPPAAYRYTEARLSKIANEMLRDIDKDTVDWDPNFDETRREPRVLPCRFPNLLVNGSSGIAVGMATNIPPHNLTEVINACVCVLENPDATLSDLMQHVTGPDFPTRGIIVGRSGIRAAYATGRGRVVVRARTETETWGHDRIRIIVTELPYQVNKRQLIQNISEQVRDKKLDGISGLRDESDRNGMRIVIELKKDANTQVVLNRLFAQTQMQTTFAVNMLALVDNQSQPKILSCGTFLTSISPFRRRSSSGARSSTSRKRSSARICLRVCSSPRRTSTRSSASSARAMTTPRKTSCSASACRMCRRRPSSICASRPCRVSSARSCKTNMTSLSSASPTSASCSPTPKRSRACCATSSSPSATSMATSAKRKFRTSRTILILRTSSRRSSACSHSRTAATSSVCPSTSTPRKSAAARACARRRCATRTMSRPSLPPRPMTTSSSSPTAAAATARRATSSPRPDAPRAA